MASWSNESILVFIKMYRSEESLWKLKSKNYNNRLIKEKAYEKLVDFVKTFEPEATKDTVIKKINNLRGSFRKELKKVESFKLSGVESDEIYHPKLWYFSCLLFLKDQEIQSKWESSSTSKRGQPFHYRHETDDTLDSETSSLSFDEDVGEPVDLLAVAATVLPRQHKSALDVRHPPKRKSCDDEQQVMHYNNIISGNRLTTPRPAATATTATPPPPPPPPATTTTAAAAATTTSSVMREDEFDVYGKSMAWKLRNLPRHQRIHVEKLFADVLYEAELGNLSKQSVVLAKPFSEEIIPHSTSQAHAGVSKIETIS